MNFTLNGRILKYVNEECILFKFRNCYWNEISICVSNDGYKIIRISDKIYKLHRIIGYLFLGLDIENIKQYIDHIDGNRLNNDIENLRIANDLINSRNRVFAKGYTYSKKRNKFIAQISICYDKKIYLGGFDTEEEARQAYLDAKQKYHLIE